MPGVSVSKPLFLAMVSLICVGAFLNGLRFARMTKNPWAGRTMFGRPMGGHDLPIERVQLMGKLQMIAAPIFFLFFIAMVSGLFGPVKIG